MYCKTITYTDYDNSERTEDFYFNLTQAELVELELTTDGGMEKTINTLIREKDTAKIVKIFKELILKAYGEKSDNGKYFNKSAEISERFAHTEAYSVLFMELATDAEAASKFFNGIVPAAAKNASNVISMPTT